MSRALAICCLLAGSFAPADVQLERPVPQLRTGAKFRQALDALFVSSRRDSPLRATLRQIADSSHISILLDRRIDPTTGVTAEFNGLPLRDALDEIAAIGQAEVTVVGNTICIGPSGPIARLRTLAALRFAELQQMAADLPRGRFAELGDRRTLHWDDLDRPADILHQISERYDLRMEGLDRIPHDLWAGNTLPETHAVEALCLVLNQFDLTFAWNDKAMAIRIVPAPPTVSIERVYTPRRTAAALAASQWMEKIEGLKATADGRRVRVSGTVEQHEAVAALLNPRRARPAVGETKDKPIPLERRTYPKLRFQRVPAIALIRRLEKTGIVFIYDEQELQKAGIDLNQPISMDLEDVSADEVFREFCRLLGLKFRTEGVTVTLSPK